MRIVNTTCYQTKQLRAIVARVAADELTAEQRKRLTLHITPTKQQRACTGYAYIKGTRAWVRVPTRVELTEWLKLDFARVIAHELAHIRGLTGERSMRSSVKYGRRLKTDEEKARQRALYGWVLGMPMDRKVAKKKEKLPVVEQAVCETPKPERLIKTEREIAKLEKRIKGWQAKKKRAENALKKYARKLKYQQKKQTALMAAQTATQE